MLLTLTIPSVPGILDDATNIGFIFHKNPATVFRRTLSFGTAQVFYPEARPERCTLVLLLEIDPIGLVRGPANSVFSYVCDRPYVASSFLSVALSECFSTALAGRSREHNELVGTPLPVTARLPVLACDAGEPLIRRLLEPLGYTVAVTHLPLDPQFPEWGDSKLYTVELTGTHTIHDVLSHLYVLLPALDNAKHYFINADEVEKLLRHGEGWLATHPEKEAIARRYLRYRKTLTADALERLADVEGVAVSEPDESAAEAPTGAVAPLRLNDHRVETALEFVRATQPAPRRLVDLGCGEGTTLRALHAAFPRLALTGMDVSTHSLQIAARRLKVDRFDNHSGITLLQGSLVYRDDRLKDHDIGLLMEVIEHLDPARLTALERAVFVHARPRRVLVTTPNVEYNSVWERLPAGKWRHPDHRFEWTRAEFQAWAQGVADANGYQVTFGGIGEEDPAGRGTPTQMAVFDVRTALPPDTAVSTDYS